MWSTTASAATRMTRESSTRCNGFAGFGGGLSQVEPAAFGLVALERRAQGGAGAVQQRSQEGFVRGLTAQAGAFREAGCRPA